jgi:hypothetical protein
MRAGRVAIWKIVLIATASVVLVGGLVGYQLLIRSFIQQYYEVTYQPTRLTKGQVAPSPPAHRLTDVPWFSEAAPLCQSISLRMLAAQQGANAPRTTIDFLMGFTWGATALPRLTGFFPGQDPEAGFLRAAPMLGFERRYRVTDDQGAFLAELKSQLARGRAVRVALDRSILLGQREAVPHSVVLVGYDEAGFEYFDPTCDEVRRCAAGERPAATPGLRMTNQQLLTAVASQALVFQYPWRYQLVVLEPLDGAKPDPTRLLPENARALIGLKSQGPSTGSVAVTETANTLERHGDSVLKPALVRGVRLAAQVRRENAETLLTLFPHLPALARAAELLDSSAKHYAAATSALETRQLETAVSELKEASKADAAAGQAILDATP